MALPSWLDTRALALLASVPLILLLAGLLAASGLKQAEDARSLSALNASVQELALTRAALQSDLSRLRADLSAQSAQSAALEARLNRTLSDLSARDAQARALADRLAASEQALGVERSHLLEQQAQVAALREEIRSMDEQLSASISWFRDNAVLTDDPISRVFVRRILSDCANATALNLACINYLAGTDEEWWGVAVLPVRYQSDFEPGVGDRFHTIRETINRQGGDCKDFSLFFKAILNSVAQDGGADLHVQAWSPQAGGPALRIHPRADLVPESACGSSRSCWSYPHSAPVDMGRLSDLHPLVVCYSRGTQVGHCVVGLARQPLEGVDGLSELEGTPLFEPQDGRYLGTIGRELALCAGGSGCWSRANTIVLVISDDDLYEVRAGAWDSYAALRERLRAVSPAAAG